MNVQKAMDLMVSVKGKRKGIDKDTKDLIKELISDGQLGEDKLNSYWLSKTAMIVLLMNENDFFNPKEIATILLKDAEVKADDWSDYDEILKVVIHEDTDKYTGGLNDQKWARELIDNGMNKFELRVGELIGIAELLARDTDGNDKEASMEIFTIVSKKAEDMRDINNIACSLFDATKDTELAVNLIAEAMDKNLPFNEDAETDFKWLEDDVKKALKNNNKTKNLLN